MFLQATLHSSELEAIQIRKLLRNWDLRKSTAEVIAAAGPNEVYRCDLEGGACIFYALVNGQPVGYVHCYLKQTIPLITSTYVVPEHRRQGLGLMVYKAIIDTNGALISDFDRSEGAEALWRKLSTDATIDVRDYDGSRLIAVDIEAEIN